MTARGILTRINPEGLKALRQLALDRDTTVQALMIEAAKLGFKAHPHMLRHACGFALANKGHDTRALQAYLGHKNIQHTVAIPSFRRIGSRTFGDSADASRPKYAPLPPA